MMKNYKLIICLFLLLGSALAKAQATYDFQVAAVSPEPFSVAVGEEGQIFIDVGYLGDAPVPIGGIRVQLSISGEIEIPLPVNFSDNGCYMSGSIWAVTYIAYINGNTEVVLKNMVGVMNDGVSCSMTIPFIGKSVSCEDCGAISCNASFTDEAIGIGDTNGNNNSATALFTVTAPLPIKLGEFNAKVDDCSSVNVTWNTYSEENFDRAEVQKSVDGRNFVTIGSVKTKGNGASVNNSYVFTDNTPLVSGTVYYRLKAIDLDNSISYSRVATAIVKCDNAIDMNIYPNPTHGEANVTFSGFKTNNMREMLLLNVKGDVVKNFKMDPLSNNNLNISELPSGVYYLKLVDESIVLQKKFIKVN